MILWVPLSCRRQTVARLRGEADLSGQELAAATKEESTAVHGL
jgi:hypothetical protein